MSDQFFDDASLLDTELPLGGRCPSTPETQARYQELKNRRLGDTWIERGRIYRKGAYGITFLRKAGPLSFHANLKGTGL